MKRLWFLIFVFYGCSVFAPLQKGKVISLYHLIETGKYEDAKELAEEMALGEESSQWANTWYARGLLSQTAYREGIKNNDPKMYELYPGQLYVAWESYERARTIDKRERMLRQLSPKYVNLANDFQELGHKELKKGNYQEALKAFEQTLAIEKLPFLSLKQDTSLIYNTGLAAYQGKNWDKAKQYLGKLHKYRYSPNATHLLFRTQMMMEDTTAAEQVLYEGLQYYDDHEDLVLLLVQVLYNHQRIQEALEVIDAAILEDPETPSFYYSKGLIHQKSGNYRKAIDAYKNAVNLDPSRQMAYVNIATCYYNIGVTYEETALKLTDKRAVVKEREKSEKAFQMALSWLEQAMKAEPTDTKVVEKIRYLLEAMGRPEKAQRLLRNFQ